MFEDLKRAAGPPTAADWNRLLERLESLVVSPGPGLLMRRAKSGTTLWPRPGRRGGPGGDRDGCTIVPAKFTKEDDEWKVIFTPAKLWEQSLKNAGKAHEITAEGPGGKLTDEEPPEVPLATGDNEVWLTWDIDPDVTVADDSVKLLIGDPPDVEPFAPNRPDGGSSAGGGKQKLGTIHLPEDGRPSWTPESPHAVVHLHVPEIEDTGDGESIYNTYEDGIDKFRTLANASDDGEQLIKPESEDSILFKSLKNQEGEEGAGIINDGGGEDDSVIFARIRGRSSPTQIKVTKEGSGSGAYVKVEGNGYDSSESGVRKFDIDIVDGLVTSLLKDADDGWWGELWFVWQPAASSQEYWEHLKLTFEAGILAKVKYGGGDGDGDTGSGDGAEEVVGTEETPGGAYFPIAQ